MLLPGLQGQHIADTTLGIHGAAHQTAGHLPDVLLLGGKETHIRAAIADRDAQGLALAGNNVRVVMAGRLEHSHRHRVGGQHQQSAPVVGGGAH